jgi:hypothetical protein
MRDGHTDKHVPEMSEGPAENSFLQTAGYVTTGQLTVLKAPFNLTVIIREE